MTIGTRIKQLRKTLGLTQQEFADKIKVSRSNIATYEVEKNNPADAVTNLICREFDVSEQWLRTGEGDMFIAKSREDELADFVSKLLRSGPDDIRRRFVAVISKLSTEELEILERAALRLAEDTNSLAIAPIMSLDKEPESLPSQLKESHKITVEEAEAEYIKAMSERVQKQEYTASSTTADDTRRTG